MNKKSFTLIELLVVIAIIGILSSLVIARFSDWGDNARIANTLQWSSGVHRTLGANLVGHWPLNEGSEKVINDISGYNGNQVLGNGLCDPGDGTCPGWVINGAPGSDNHALEFDGVDDYIDIDSFDYPLTWDDAFTVSIWIYVPSSAVWDNGNHGNIFARAFYGGSHGLARINNDNQVGMYIRGDNGSIMATGFVTRDKWYHLLGVWSGESASLYINGELKEETGTSRTGNPTNVHDWSVGGAKAFSSSAGNWFTGKMSDARIYDIALTAEEVGRIYAESRDRYLAQQ